MSQRATLIYRHCVSQRAALTLRVRRRCVSQRETLMHRHCVSQRATLLYRHCVSQRATPLIWTLRVMGQYAPQSIYQKKYEITLWTERVTVVYFMASLCSHLIRQSASRLIFHTLVCATWEKVCMSKRAQIRCYCGSPQGVGAGPARGVLVLLVD